MDRKFHAFTILTWMLRARTATKFWTSAPPNIVRDLQVVFNVLNWKCAFTTSHSGVPFLDIYICQRCPNRFLLFLLSTHGSATLLERAFFLGPTGPHKSFEDRNVSRSLQHFGDLYLLSSIFFLLAFFFLSSTLLCLLSSLLFISPHSEI